MRWKQSVGAPKDCPDEAQWGIIDLEPATWGIPATTVRKRREGHGKHRAVSAGSPEDVTTTKQLKAIALSVVDPAHAGRSWAAWPQRLAAWRKARRRARQRLAALRKSDAVVISYAKSGRTWLRAQLSSLYHQRYGVPESELIDSGNFHRHDQRIPRILFTHAGSREPWEPDQALGQIARKKVLFLARDPRDVAVSLYYERAKRNSPEARARAGFAEGTDALPLYDFLVERNGGALLKVIRFLNEWAAILPRLPGALWITYEEMQAQPHATLRRVVEHLDQPFSAAEIDQAIAFASFDSLRQKEQHGFFRSSKLRPGDPDDPQSFKVRRGKVGGWRDELTAIQAAEIDRIVERELVPVHLPAQQRVGLARVVARW